MSEAIKNDIKEGSWTPTELSKQFVNVELWVRDLNRGCVVDYGTERLNTTSDQ